MADPYGQHLVKIDAITWSAIGPACINQTSQFCRY